MEKVFLQTHESSEKVPLEQLIEEHLDHEQLKQGLVATDMDGTMFKNDLGLLVFVELLCRPDLWNYTPKQFKKLLVPPAYGELMIKGSNGGMPNLPMEECKKALVLKRDIVLLYKAHYDLRAKGEKLTVKHPVVIEFVRKMIELDGLIMVLEPYWRSHFNGKLLMRTRFFSAKSKNSVNPLISRTLARKDPSDPNNSLTLQTFPEHKETFGQSLGPEDLDTVVIDRVVQVRRKIEMVLKKFHSEHGLPVVIVTTNFDKIARGVTQNEPYDFIKNRRWWKNVKGTRIKKKKPEKGESKSNRRYTPELRGIPPLGEEKRRIAQEVAKRRQRIVLVACGDSLAGDGAMGLLALENGGVFIAAGDKYDDTRAKFKPLCREAIQKGVRDAANKIWYAVSE